jgi:hypothetical protein
MALDELKALISKPLVLASLEPGEALLLCVAATTQVISIALLVEQDEPGTSTRCKSRSTTSTMSSPTARLAIIRYKSY